MEKVQAALALGCTDQAQAYFLYGVALSVPEVGRYAEAMGALRECLRINPAHEHVLDELEEVAQVRVGRY